jgi:hypothetical protein
MNKNDAAATIQNATRNKIARLNTKITSMEKQSQKLKI